MTKEEKGLTLAERIEGKIKEIDSDERFHYSSAMIFENAPLALIQLGMESKMSVLKWILPLVEAEAARTLSRLKEIRDAEMESHDDDDTWICPTLILIDKYITELEGMDKAEAK